MYMQEQQALNALKIFPSPLNKAYTEQTAQRTSGEERKRSKMCFDRYFIVHISSYALVYVVCAFRQVGR